MAYKGIYRVLNMSWGWMLMLFIIFPVIGLVLQLMLLFLSVASDEIDGEFPIMIVPFFGLMGAYLWWQWVISEKLNRGILKDDFLPNAWFKRSFYLMSFVFIITLVFVFGYAFFYNLEIMVSGWVDVIISFFTFILMMTVIAAYIYSTYFTSAVLDKLFKNKPFNRDFPYNLPTLMIVWVFPFGIPLLNKRIKQL